MDNDPRFNESSMQQTTSTGDGENQDLVPVSPSCLQGVALEVSLFALLRIECILWFDDEDGNHEYLRQLREEEQQGPFNNQVEFVEIHQLPGP